MDSGLWPTAFTGCRLSTNPTNNKRNLFIDSPLTGHFYKITGLDMIYILILINVNPVQTAFAPLREKTYHPEA